MTVRPPAPAEARGTRLSVAAFLLAAFFAAVAAFSPLHAGTTDASPGIGPGMRMYRDGILPSGEMMRGVTSGRAFLSGGMAACEKCHRRSGMGSYEGGTRVRFVTGAALYRPEGVFGTGHDRKLPGIPRIYPAYTDETLARAIRDGMDPEGRRFNAAMPRYDLSDTDLALLIGYLRSLPMSGAPGVTEKAIRFATVVDARVSPARRNAQ